MTPKTAETPPTTVHIGVIAAPGSHNPAIADMATPEDMVVAVQAGPGEAPFAFGITKYERARAIGTRARQIV